MPSRSWAGNGDSRGTRRRSSCVSPFYSRWLSLATARTAGTPDVPTLRHLGMRIFFLPHPLPERAATTAPPPFPPPLPPPLPAASLGGGGCGGGAVDFKSTSEPGCALKPATRYWIWPRVPRRADSVSARGSHLPVPLLEATTNVDSTGWASRAVAETVKQRAVVGPSSSPRRGTYSPVCQETLVTLRYSFRTWS